MTCKLRLLLSNCRSLKSLPLRCQSLTPYLCIQLLVIQHHWLRNRFALLCLEPLHFWRYRWLLIMLLSCLSHLSDDYWSDLLSCSLLRNLIAHHKACSTKYYNTYYFTIHREQSGPILNKTYFQHIPFNYWLTILREVTNANKD